MNIVKLILHNYKRFFLNDIKHLEYTPVSKTQLILGSNGAGKSSLLEQLTPLPPNLKKDFLEDGYKEIIITKDSDTYKLNSSLERGHSFKVNDIELNHNNKITVQLQLVLEHFGITPNINQVLLGYNSFTDMSPNERKKWLTAMSSIDYSYAIKVYNNLRSRHRDIVGGIKLLQSNIVKTEKGSLPDVTLDALKNDKENITNIVDYLFTIIKPTTDNTDLDLSIGKVENIVGKLSTLTISTDSNIESMRDNLSKTKAKVSHIEEQLKIKYNELLDVNNIVTTEDKLKIVEELNTINTNINDLLVNTKLPKLNSFESVYNTLISNYTDLVSLLSPLSKYPETLATSDNHNKILTMVDTYTETLNTKERTLYRLEERVANLDKINNEVNDVTCPECSHEWKPNYSKSEHNNAKDKLTSLRRDVLTIRNELSKYKSILGNIVMIRDTLSNFFKYFNVSEDLRTIFTYMISSIKDKNYIHNYIFSRFENMVNELHYLHPIIKLQDRKQELISKLKLIEEREKIHTDINLLNKDRLELHIQKLQEDKDINNDIINKLNKEINNIINSKELLKELKLSLNTVYRVKENMINNSFNSEIRLAISRFRNILEEIDNTLATNIKYETMLSTYQKELNELKHSEKLLKIAVKELGPSEGLIAKSMSSFLNCFIQDMNHIIFMVWGTNMEILSCDILENDLDYKFKVLVNNTDIVEDISKGSSSMKEVINLAFKIVFSRYMGLTGSGLMLDEFGRTLDSKHRITSYEALTKELSNEFNQVFLISHFCSVYGRFINSDVSILSTDGVDMTSIDKYNEVLKISN